MRSLVAAALVVAAAFGASGCRSSGAAAPAGGGAGVAMKIKGYRVVWTRGGKLGYLKTFDVSRPEEPTVELHYVCDLEFRDIGWIANDGQAERYEIPEQKVREAYRESFERVTLPVDTLENQVRRIFGWTR